MFNGNIKEKAIKELEKSVNQYNAAISDVQTRSELLFKLRGEASGLTIHKVEKYVSRLANTPKEFSKEFIEIRATFDNFNHYVSTLKDEAAHANYIAGGSGAGALMGVGVATLGPTAALAVATTFGTASTGTAIAALSGGAATNAALAWLGGGALVAGGGGMAAGQAFLALSGPIGWGIGAVAIVGGGFWMRSKNKSVATEANARRAEIDGYTLERKATTISINGIILLTRKEISGIDKLLATLEASEVVDYTKLSSQEKDQLIALINHTRALGKLLNKLPEGSTGTTRKHQTMGEILKEFGETSKVA